MLHNAGVEAATCNTCTAVIVGRFMIALVRLTPDGNLAAGAAQVNRLALRVTFHLLPMIIESRTDALAHITDDDRAIFFMFLITHRCTSLCEFSTPLCLPRLYCTAAFDEKLLAKANKFMLLANLVNLHSSIPFS